VASLLPSVDERNEVRRCVVFRGEQAKDVDLLEPA
jgi:hypothetical protein